MRGQLHDRVVSIRLTEEERAFLDSLGRPTDVLRGWIRDARNRAEKTTEMVAWTTGPSVRWWDGTTGPTHPVVITR